MPNPVRNEVVQEALKSKSITVTKISEEKYRFLKSKGFKIEIAEAPLVKRTTEQYIAEVKQEIKAAIAKLRAEELAAFVPPPKYTTVKTAPEVCCVDHVKEEK